MNLTAIDWAIVASYFLLSTVIGLMFTKRGGESRAEGLEAHRRSVSIRLARPDGGKT